MHSARLLADLKSYEHYWSPREKTWAVAPPGGTLQQFRHFATTEPRCFERALTTGHVTASSLIVTSDLQKILLCHHKKLNRWLQLGGHADGDTETHRVAYKEAEEESGLTDLHFINYAESDAHVPIDIDIHEIPPNQRDPRHLHFDVRYLLATDSPEEIVCSDESNHLRWFDVPSAHALQVDTSLRRLFNKLQLLKKERSLTLNKGGSQ